MERVVQWNWESRDIIKRLPNQHAYTRGLSCDSAVSQVVDIAERGLLQQGYAVGVFLDSQGAFDRASLAAIEQGLAQNNCPRAEITFILESLSRRRITPDTLESDRDPELSICPTRGTPQGGILSPSFWAMVADLALAHFNCGEVTVVRYADDEAIMASGENLEQLISGIQIVVDRLVEVNQGLGLCYSASKSQAMIFTAKQKPTFDLRQATQIKVQGSHINYSQNVKYLGVHLQTNLGWSTHLEATLAGITRKLFAVRRITSPSNGLPMKATRWIYDGIIIPKTTYCSIVWSSGLTQANERTLAKINRLGINLSIFPKKSSPTIALEVMLNRPPLGIVAHRLALNTWARLRDSLGQTWSGITRQPKRKPYGHRLALENKLMELVPEDSTFEQRNVERMVPTMDAQVVSSIRHEPEDNIIFTRTNAEGLPNITVSNIHRTKTYTSRIRGTEQITTLLSIWYCLEAHGDNGGPQRFILEDWGPIKGCLKDVSDFQIEHKIKERCRVLLNRGRPPEFRICADTRFPSIRNRSGTQEWVSPCTVNTIKELTDSYGRSQWKLTWEASKSVKQSLFHDTLQSPDGAMWEKLKEVPKTFAREIIEVCTGHGNLRYMMNLKDQTDETECRLCGEGIESGRHLWFECRVTKVSRIPRSAAETVNKANQILENGARRLLRSRGSKAPAP